MTKGNPKIIAVFPGQASMDVTLARQLVERSENVQKSLSICSDYIGVDIVDVIENFPDHFQRTSIVQPAMTASSKPVYPNIGAPYHRAAPPALAGAGETRLAL